MILDDLPGTLAAALAIEERQERAERLLAIIEEAMTALGFVKDPAGVKRAIGRADALDPRQREGLAHLAAHPGLPIRPYAVPSAGWAIRQWLGLDPPGPLFAVDGAGATLFDTLRAAFQRSEHEAIGRLVALPMPLRLEVLADLQLLIHDYGGATTHVAYLLGSRQVAAPTPEPVGVVLPEIGAVSGAWARKIADRMIAINDAPPIYHRSQPPGNRMSLFETEKLSLPVFLAMARGGSPIESRYDRLLWFDRWTDPAIAHECIAAIPEERREQAIVDTLRARNDRVFAASEILPRYPYVGIARFMLSDFQSAGDPKAVLRAVKAAAKTNPAIQEELARHATSIPKLRVAGRKAPPKLADLDEMAVKQLEAASVGFDGTARTAAQILGGEAGEELDPASIELVTLQGARGQSSYDAWIFGPDSGAIFRAGTTDLVADRVQGDLQCGDPALRAALQDALNKPKPTKRSTKPGAKKSGPKGGASGRRKRPAK